MGNTIERRQDVGSKVLISIVALLVTVILSISIGVASIADKKANKNTIAVTEVKTTQTFILDDVKEIKSDVKDIWNVVVK